MRKQTLTNIVNAIVCQNNKLKDIEDLNEIVELKNQIKYLNELLNKVLKNGETN